MRTKGGIEHVNRGESSDHRNFNSDKPQKSTEALELPFLRRSRKSEDCDSHLIRSVLIFLVFINYIIHSNSEVCRSLSYMVLW
jgi:hypothetical protein